MSCLFCDIASGKLAADILYEDDDLLIVDKDLSSTSRQITSKFKGSPFFNIVEGSFSVKKAVNAAFCTSSSTSLPKRNQRLSTGKVLI